MRKELNSERVHFYSERDMASGMYFDRLEEVLSINFCEGRSLGLEDAIELHNTKAYIDANIRSSTWDDRKFEDFKTSVTKFPGIIIQYLNSTEGENLLKDYSELNFDYRSNFWEVINKYNLGDLLDTDMLSCILERNPYDLRLILRCKVIIVKHSKYIRDVLVADLEAVEYLLEEYALPKEDGHKKYYFPKQFTISDKHNLIERYLNSDKPNLNYVRAIRNLKDSSELSITTKLRLRAKHIDTELNKKILEKNGGVYSQIICTIDKSDNIPHFNITNGENTDLLLTFGYNSISKMSPPEIINNISSINNQGLLTLTSKKCDYMMLEHVFMSEGKDTYNTGIIFRMNDTISKCTHYAYRTVIEEEGNSMVAMFKSYYDDYLKAQYSCQTLPLNILPNSSDWIGMIRTILAEMDSVGKQHDLYVQEKEVNSELLELMKPSSFITTKSLVKKKYVYFKEKGKKLENLAYILFSNQSTLAHINLYKSKGCQSFIKIITNEDKVTCEDFGISKMRNLEFLIENNIIFINEEGVIKITDMYQIDALRSLWKEGVACYWGCTEGERFYLDKWLKEGYLETEDTLLSRLERDYFDYWLNNKKYTNGPQIRNKYMHGANPPASEENIHVNTYYRLEVLFAILLRKIEIDLQLYHTLKHCNLEREVY